VAVSVFRLTEAIENMGQKTGIDTLAIIGVRKSSHLSMESIIEEQDSST
jgi:hypothetical protein